MGVSPSVEVLGVLDVGVMLCVVDPLVDDLLRCDAGVRMVCPLKTLVVNHSTRFGSWFSERTQAAISAASSKFNAPSAEIS